MKFKGVKKETRPRKPRKIERELVQSLIKQEKPLIKSEKTTFEAKKENLSPNIHRFITDSRLWIITVAILILAILSLALVMSIRQAQAVATERRELLLKEQSLLQKNDQYPGDKDILVRLAMVLYQLHDNKSAQKYIKEIYAIDPEFSPARALERVLSL